MVSSVSGGGSDACAAWESRLRAARTLVRSAHHAQRRSVSPKILKMIFVYDFIHVRKQLNANPDQMISYTIVNPLR